MLISLVLIVVTVSYLNNKIMDHQERNESKAQEQALIDASSDEPIDVEVIELDRKVKKVVAKLKSKPSMDQQRTTSSSREPHAAENNGELRDQKASE